MCNTKWWHIFWVSQNNTFKEYKLQAARSQNCNQSFKPKTTDRQKKYREMADFQKYYLLTAASDADIVAGITKSSKIITDVKISKANGAMCTFKSAKLKNGYRISKLAINTDGYFVWLCGCWQGSMDRACPSWRRKLKKGIKLTSLHNALQHRANFDAVLKNTSLKFHIKGEQEEVTREYA